MDSKEELALKISSIDRQITNLMIERNKLEDDLFKKIKESKVNGNEHTRNKRICRERNAGIGAEDKGMQQGN